MVFTNLRKRPTTKFTLPYKRMMAWYVQQYNKDAASAMHLIVIGPNSVSMCAQYLAKRAKRPSIALRIDAGSHRSNRVAATLCWP